MWIEWGVEGCGCGGVLVGKWGGLGGGLRVECRGFVESVKKEELFHCRLIRNTDVQCEG